MHIWNTEIIKNKIFPTNLKVSDISPIFKKEDSTLVKNYRPISVLPVVPKILEKIMEEHLSQYLCGYRKGFNAQHALIALIEKWKESGAIFMDLSKAFDTINHQRLVAKLYAYGFEKGALTLILNYLSNRW